MNKAYLEFTDQAAEGLPRATIPLSATQPGVEAALLTAIDRLEEVIETESKALLAAARIDFDEINRAKSRCLLELTRLSRSVPKAPNQALRKRLGEVRVRLDDNLRLVGLHMAAVREVAEFIADGIARSESDGTYSRRSFVR